MIESDGSNRLVAKKSYCFTDFLITVIDQRFKFGAILVLTLIQLSNGLDCGLVVPQVRKKLKN